MPSLSLVLYPDPRLRQRSGEIEPDALKAPAFSVLLNDMRLTMKKYKGIGLAAVQVGVMQRVAIIETKDGILPLINPKILKRSWRKETDDEGCLSIPGVFGPVKRYYEITISTLTPNGEKQEVYAKGLFARVIQHEIDHMDGVLFTDLAPTLRMDGKIITAADLDTITFSA